MAAIGELAGMVGHDLRNPLTGIKNAVYYLEKKGNSISSENSRMMFDTINNCIEHSNKIINDLLDYSREIPLELKQLTPTELVSKVLDMVKVPEKVQVVRNLSDNRKIWVDENKLERVFVNLITNAVDAMSNGGKITIDSRNENNKIEFSVSDTGMGISQDVLPKIFTPLFTTKAQGMGFGLAICKRIVEAHRGTITVKNAMGGGATFIITLPTEPKHEAGGERGWINVPESLLSTMIKR